MADQNKSRGRRLIENIFTNIVSTGVATQQAKASAQSAAQGASQGTQQATAAVVDRESWWDKMMKRYPMATREDNTGFSTLCETFFSIHERERINNLLNAMKRGVYINGKKYYYDNEQFIMDMWEESETWKRTMKTQPQAPAQAKGVPDRSYQRGLGTILAMYFNDDQAEVLDAFWTAYDQKGYHGEQLRLDIWKIYEKAKKANPDLDDLDNPAVIILMNLVDKEHFDEQEKYVKTRGLLTAKDEAAPEVGGGNPVVKLLQEVVGLNSIEEQIRHLQQSQRLKEMGTSGRLARFALMNKGHFTGNALVTGYVAIMAIVVGILLLF